MFEHICAFAEDGKPNQVDLCSQSEAAGYLRRFADRIEQGETEMSFELLDGRMLQHHQFRSVKQTMKPETKSMLLRLQTSPVLKIKKDKASKLLLQELLEIGIKTSLNSRLLNHPIDPKGFVRVVTDAASIIEEYISDAGGCDHKVGICMCHDIEVLTQLTSSLGIKIKKQRSQAL